MNHHMQHIGIAYISIYIEIIYARNFYLICQKEYFENLAIWIYYPEQTESGMVKYTTML